MFVSKRTGKQSHMPSRLEVFRIVGHCAGGPRGTGGLPPVTNGHWWGDLIGCILLRLPRRTTEQTGELPIFKNQVAHVMSL